MDLNYKTQGENNKVSFLTHGSNFKISKDNKSKQGSFELIDSSTLTISIGSKKYTAYFAREGYHIFIHVNGRSYTVERAPLTRKGIDTSIETNIVISPITGKLLELNISVGDVVQKGDLLAIMEAMKMEHRVKAPKDGKISKLTSAVPGSQIKEGEIVAELEDV